MQQFALDLFFPAESAPDCMLVNADCLEVLRMCPDNSIDSIVTDPPYGLSFMGKRWDYDVPSVEVWAECLRVLKPGGHLLAFAGTRTQHRMAVRIEDAGFEIRDMIAWVYGCLDEATEVATERGVVPYHKTKIGDRVLCYDVEHGEYTYQPILEIVEYNYSDTAYRLVGDFGEQVVSRSHRVIVERDGSEAFQLAETLECEARVPILESLPALRQAVHDAHQRAGSAQQDVQCHLCKCADWRCERGVDSTGSAQGQDDQVRSLREQCMEACRMAAQGGDADLQQGVQRGATRCRVGRARAQGTGKLDSRVGGRIEGANDRRIEPCLEGRADLPQSEGRVCASADQVREMPGSDVADGAVGQLCDGASTGCGADHQPAADAEGVRSPHQPRRDGQPGGEPDVVYQQRAAQGVRAWGGHRSAVVRVVPFHYTGKVWCLRVPTGAFVAVRNGVAFPTGNSGFPKSLDVSKAIDKAAGVEREVLGTVDPRSTFDGRERNSAAINTKWRGAEGRDDVRDLSKKDITAPATNAARQWQGWGTALKPALEPITVARKPLVGTVAENVLAHGTGALNIDGCRIEGGERPLVTSDRRLENNTYAAGLGGSKCEGTTSTGRWPANLIHDGSDEVLAAFPQAPGQQGRARTDGSDQGNNVFGALAHITKQPEPRGDSGSAARFFQQCKGDYNEEWQDQNLTRSSADTAEQSSSLQNHLAATVQNAVAIWPSLAGILSSEQTAASTRVTLNESKAISETAMQAMSSIASGFSQESQHERLTPCGSLVRTAATRRPTGTTTITTSLCRSDGSAEVATFTITPSNLDRGEAVFRFSYCAKASKRDRDEGLDGFAAAQTTFAAGTGLRNNGDGTPRNQAPSNKNIHPTVKPTDLMRYLCRLVTPPGGVVLDPFMGSGSTGKAARQEGFLFLGIEREAQYVEIAKARILSAQKAGV